MEIQNEKDRESENLDDKRRALNLDKLKEIYDHVANAKRDGKKHEAFM